MSIIHRLSESVRFWPNSLWPAYKSRLFILLRVITVSVCSILSYRMPFVVIIVRFDACLLRYSFEERYISRYHMSVFASSCNTRVLPLCNDIWCWVVCWRQFVFLILSHEHVIFLLYIVFPTAMCTTIVLFVIFLSLSFISTSFLVSVHVAFLL